MLKNYAAVFGFLVSVISLFTSLCIGLPLQVLSPKVWRAWCDLARGTYGTLMTALLWFTSPAVARMYTSSSHVSFRTRDGYVETKISPRAVVISNHQIYSDWVYLWWFAYTANLHGAMVIALKKSLRKIPLLGKGMEWFRFLFLSRKWEDDEKHILETTDYLASDPKWPTWMTIFPEGTVVNSSTQERGEVYAAKSGFSTTLLPKHLLLPRVKGLQTILKGLKGSVPVLYDITIVYETGHGVPRGSEPAETRFSLKRSFLQSDGPKVVKMHVREFPLSEVPYEGSEAVFQDWLFARWIEKDQIYADLAAGRLESEFQAEGPIKPRSLLELYQCFNVPITAAILGRLLVKFVRNFRTVESVDVGLDGIDAVLDELAAMQ